MIYRTAESGIYTTILSRRAAYGELNKIRVEDRIITLTLFELGYFAGRKVAASVYPVPDVNEYISKQGGCLVRARLWETGYSARDKRRMSSWFVILTSFVIYYFSL